MKLRSELIRQFIIEQVGEHPNDLANLVAQEFAISRQAANRHIKILVEDGILESSGTTRSRSYSLKVIRKRFAFPLKEFREEDVVWREYVAPNIVGIKENVYGILQYAFTEMFNNVIDHSGGTEALVVLESNPAKISITVIDDGVGIFEKIRAFKGLRDHREAILELSKGGLTTDSKNHSGQGIFFTSRMLDEFIILADGLFYIRNAEKDDWLIETSPDPSGGTFVKMSIATNSTRTTREVFDRFADVDYGFKKTHVPLKLAKYGEELLVSRSQAKRVLDRFDRFDEVLLDFKGVDSVGQAFADEIFRVYRRSHPDTRIIAIHTSDQIEKMIKRAQSED
ncbi:STAS-like domain-containing protein [Tundrisphaera sp. TA3]|uniref:STAS-like domain-containing protein n=1 Tax=Tundrisphaera sp. TA3 TaxID=3435775 RepID=UPI003EBF2D6A